MLVKKLKQIAKSSAYLAILSVMVVQFFGVAFVSSQKVLAQGSSAPDGETKTFIIKYDSLPGEPSESKGVEQTRAKYHWQKNQVMSELTETRGYKKIIHNLKEMPISIMSVDAEGEKSLRANKRIVSITENYQMKPTMKDVIPLIGGTVASGFSDGSNNFTGDNTTIAIIDSGVTKTHPMFSGKVVSEACYGEEYSDTAVRTIESVCPGGATSSTATDSAVQGAGESNHGNSVAGAAAGLAGTYGPDDYSGVAKSADIIAIKIHSKITEKAGQADQCGDVGDDTEVCFNPFFSGMVSAYDRVLEIHNQGLVTNPIVSVNNSNGFPAYNFSDSTTCDAFDDTLVAPIAALKAVNIASTIAAGNSGNTDGGEGTTYVSNADKVSFPSCLSGSVAVGSSRRSSATMSYYSQGGPRIDLVAPGGDLGSGDPDGGVFLPSLPSSLTAGQGTSYAAPMVAGAWAVIREKNPTATVDTVERVLQETGATIAENRASYTVMNHKQIVLDDALASFNTKPSITSLTPSGSGFVEGDTVNVDIVAPNATTCTLGGTTVNLTAGAGVMPIVATSGAQTYSIVCEDAQGYAAVLGVSFTATASSQPPFQGGGGPGDGDVLIGGPGTPNTGFGLFLNNPLAIIVSTSIAALGIILIARKTKLTTKASRR